MENKVNYAVVGAFVLVLGAALIAGVLWLAAGWIGLQVLFGWYASATAGVSVATAAHVGGFVAGLALTPLLLTSQRRSNVRH